jgi:hypothetical protein
MTKQTAKIKLKDPEHTSITKIPQTVRERVKRYRKLDEQGNPQTYTEILTSMMDRIDHCVKEHGEPW